MAPASSVWSRSPPAIRSRAWPSSPAATGVLGTLFAFDGLLHLGYGDYSDNTGPIAMSAWDPELDAFVDLGTLPTEEVQWFRPGAGVLYSPAIDPDGHEEVGGIYRLDCGGQWSSQCILDAEFTGHDPRIAVSGGGTTHVVYRQLDEPTLWHATPGDDGVDQACDG